MNLVIRKLGTHHFRIWVIYSIHACFGQGFLNVTSYLKIRLNSGMNRNSDRVSGSGLPNPELSKTPFRFRLNRSRILNVSGIRPDIPVPSRAQYSLDLAELKVSLKSQIIILLDLIFEKQNDHLVRYFKWAQFVCLFLLLQYSLPSSAQLKYVVPAMLGPTF